MTNEIFFVTNVLALNIYFYYEIISVQDPKSKSISVLKVSKLIQSMNITSTHNEWLVLVTNLKN